MAEAARFDAVVVGAGPAGSAAAIALARAGRSVCLLERGPFPGSKNMYGGVIYGRVLDSIIPRWWEQAPVQRWVTRRSTMIMTPTQAITVDVRSSAWGEPPYNGATALRPDFDAWLADHALAAGAELICSTTATGLRRDEAGRVCGVRTDRPDGDIDAQVVIAADGVNTFLAKEAGLIERSGVEQYALGVKEVLGLSPQKIEERFGVRGRAGMDIEILGATGDIAGGGFVYTNLESIAVGLVLSLPGLSRSGRRPEEILATMKAHPAIEPMVAGGELLEYSAHIVPEGGYDMVPTLATDGMLVAGDAAGLTLAAGIYLEGVNFAIGSGHAAGLTAAEAIAHGDVSTAALAGYRRRLEQSFVLADHRKMRRAHTLVLGERAQRLYPGLVARVAERLFTVENPRPKRGLTGIVVGELRASGLRARDLARDAYLGLRTFG
ncbi:MAG TPA: FAD-dependent oxidoreductase [Solirubrobacteraceae bacterium]|jgi:electron transfer flavoprotein-quinone oxidoreductase|nr:FAD-dependent oxidoreductase [Solirubrobacteraceae bacterium]